MRSAFFYLLTKINLILLISMHHGPFIHGATEKKLVLHTIIKNSIEFVPMLSKNKSQALRSVNYFSSSKVILVFHSAWWNKSKAELGGTVITGMKI